VLQARAFVFALPCGSFGSVGSSWYHGTYCGT